MSARRAGYFGTSVLVVLMLQLVLTLAAEAQTDTGTADVIPGLDLTKGIQTHAQWFVSHCSGLTTADQCDEQWLTFRGVALTKDDLISAVHSGDSDIAGPAIDLLAMKGVTSAIPDIAALLDSTSDPAGRIHMAWALAKLGDERGVQTLQSYCDDRSVPMGDRLYAAETLQSYQPKSCPETLIEGLQNDTFRVQALGMIPHFKELTAKQSAQVRALLLKSLSDSDFEIRLQAAQTIEGLGDASLIPPLQAAMVRESNASVKEAMAYAIEALQKKSQSSASPASK